METTRESGRYVVELGKDKEMDLSTLHRFFDMKMRHFYFRVCLKFWKKYVLKRKSKKRVAAYSRNTIYRNKMERFFRAWRGETHVDGKIRIADEEDVFRKAMEHEKLTMWSAKVDQLMIYMGQLEQSIKKEVSAREQLTVTYENSMNKGMNVLQTETNLLADNPLVHEISLVVAKELLTKSKQDPSALNQILTQEQRDQLNMIKANL